MNNFNNLLNKAIISCSVKECILSDDFSLIYPFTTENISGYIKLFDLKDKSLLTVGSSGDQLINALLFNPRSITHFDINPYSKFYIYLKLAGILELDKEKFLNFFRYKNYPSTFKNNKFVFNRETYNKLKNTLCLLDYESYLFWNELFDNFNNSTIRHALFETVDEYKSIVINNSNLYLKSNINYKDAKDKLKKVNLEFQNGNIITDKLDKSYNNIWLSNIGTYLSKDEIIAMYNNIYPYLENDGKLLICYLYNINEKTKFQNNWKDIYNISKMKEILNANIHYFTGVDGFSCNYKNHTDAALIHTKK